MVRKPQTNSMTREKHLTSKFHSVIHLKEKVRKWNISRRKQGDMKTKNQHWLDRLTGEKKGTGENKWNLNTDCNLTNSMVTNADFLAWMCFVIMIKYHANTKAFWVKDIYIYLLMSMMRYSRQDTVQRTEVSLAHLLEAWKSIYNA